MSNFGESLQKLDKKVEKGFDDVNRKMEARFDRLMLLIISGVALKGGFDLYRVYRPPTSAKAGLVEKGRWSKSTESSPHSGK